MMQDLGPVNGHDSMERCQLGNCIVDLPENICEQQSLFKEILNEDTWNTVLSSEQRNYLLKFLPRFPENDALNKQQTIRNLLSGANFWFGNPIDEFHRKLRAGYFSPDVAWMTSAMRKAKYREYRHRQQCYFYKLLQDILISRKRLMETASRLPPDQPLRMDRALMQPGSHAYLAHRPVNTVQLQAKRRYTRELQEVREEVGELLTSSEDDNYPDAVPLKLTKKQKKHLSQLEASLAAETGRVTCTIAPKPSIGTSRNHIIQSISPFEVNEDGYRHMITAHKRRRADTEFHLELDVEGITLHDIRLRANIPKRSSKSSPSESASKLKGIKDIERKKASVSPSIAIIKMEPGIDIPDEISDNPPLLTPKLEALSSGVEATNLNPLASADVTNNLLNTGELRAFMESAESNMDINFGFALPRSSTPVIVHAGHSSFFSLLRDFFYESYDCKILSSKLEEKVATWQDSSYSTLKDWYLLRTNWVELVEPALKFLSGQVAAPVLENFVPLVDYKAKLQYYHWSGEGRDSDENLSALSTFWLDARTAAVDERAMMPDMVDTLSDSPPPPRVLTDWLVQATTDEEKSRYREQERQRYVNPHRAFTFCLHGYEAIVGPVKGVYGKDGSVAKAREHSLLTSDRPPFVTILSLVRDSASRLPNGEGTRADICELLKDSQFLAPATDVQIHTVVSGALDRLHYEKDPCVKYDVNRKMWIYLHRCRTEEEFEKIHQAHATTVKTKKVGTKQKSKPMRSKTGSRPASALSTASSDSLVSLEISNTSIGGNAVSTSSFGPVSSPAAAAASASATPATKSRITTSNLKLVTSTNMMGMNPVNTAASSESMPTQLTGPSPKKAIMPSSTTAKAKSTVTPKVSKRRMPSMAIIPPALSSTPSATSSLVTKAVPTMAPKVGTFSKSSTLHIPSAVSQLVGKVDIPECVIQTSSDTFMASCPSVGALQASSRTFLSGTSQAQSNPKAAMIGMNAAHPLVNIAQVQLVCTTTNSSCTLPGTVSPATEKLHAKSVIQLSALQQKQQQEQEHQQQNKLLQRHQPGKSIGTVMAQQVAAKAITVNAQSVSAVRLVPSGISSTQSSITFGSKVFSATTLAGQPVSMSSNALQGTVPLPTFVIKQQDLSASSQVITTHQQTKPATMKPVVARIISSPQVVSVENLITSTLAATQNQGPNVQGTTTIKIQGSNLLHPMTNKGGNLNVLKTPSSVCPSTMLHQVSTTVTGIPRLALVSHGNANNLIPQGQVSKPAILTSPPGIKIVSAATTTNMSLSQLTSKTTQTMVMTSKPQTPIVTVSVGASQGATQNLILTSSGVQQSAVPAVVVASRSLKSTQTVVMAQPGGTTPTVVMSAQPTLRPMAATTTVGTSGVKVIPVTQTTAFGGKAISKTSQPLFTRIITPPAGLSIRPGVGVRATTQQGLAVFHAMASHHVPATAGLTASGNPAVALSGAHTSIPSPQQATILRFQSPPQTPKSV